MASNIWSDSTVFSVPAGQESVVSIPAPYAGELRGVVLTDTDGSSSGFSGGFYTSQQNTAPNSTLPASSFLVKSFTVTGNELAERELNIAYKNRDGDPSNHQGYLYLRITPGGTGTKNFVATLTVGTPAYL
jgi:hypothetical protein